ncbi:MAG: hypothetical protein O3C63_05940 [Cyanobacteria bacterium]|nr:hypothetical protein [Cyanobacteriota bacterium]
MTTGSKRLAPGIETLIELIPHFLARFGVSTERINKTNTLKWLIKQDLLDFGSDKAGTLTKCLRDLGNNKVDSIYFPESTLVNPNSEHKSWTEIPNKSKRIITSLLIGNYDKPIPTEAKYQLSQKQLEQLMQNILRILKPGGFAVMDQKAFGKYPQGYDRDYLNQVTQTMINMGISMSLISTNSDTSFYVFYQQDDSPLKIAKQIADEIKVTGQLTMA